MAESEEGVLKKQKTALKVKEILRTIGNSLFLYQVEWEGEFYYLDAFLCLAARQQNLFSFEPTFIFRSSKLQHPPRDSQCIANARITLGNEFVDAFLDVYKPISGNIQQLLRMGIYPHNSNNNKLIEDAKTAAVIFAIYKDNARDLSLTWMYRVLMKCKKEDIAHYLASRTSVIHHLAKLLCWKGYMRWSQKVPDQLEQLYNGEARGLALIAMARNRPRGQNVFAQLPRDVLRLLFGWIQWSLPIDL
jgi:hypothetical protein